MKKRRNSAFTITELVIIIMVLAVLASVLIPEFGNVIRNAKESATYSNCTNAVISGKISDAESGAENAVYTGAVVSEGDLESTAFYIYVEGTLYKLSDLTVMPEEVECDAEYTVTDGQSVKTITAPSNVASASFVYGIVEIEEKVFTSVFLCNSVTENYYGTAYIYDGVYFAPATGEIDVNPANEPVAVLPVSPPAHDGEHMFSIYYDYDENGHWHACTIEGCTEITGYGEHVLDEYGRCKELGCYYGH